ncbi:MAG: sel1 repeat family protein [Synergistaceae bacterium]|nr:sel1 repeat family protein [Candidatus Equadaptatus faecalis]
MKKTIKKAAILFAVISVIFAFATPVLAAQSEQALLKAANSGNKNAMFELAQFYLYEKKDEIKASQWFKKAADAGHVDAMYAMSSIVAFFANSPELAIKWTEKAANNGHPQAMYEMVERCEKQDDYKKAISWLEKTAKTNDEFLQGKAIKKLVYYYLKGQKGADNKKSVLPDETKAIKWAEKLNKEDKIQVACLIGECYYGVSGDIKLERNLTKAKKWFNIAKTAGHESEFLKQIILIENEEKIRKIAK